MKSRQSKRNRHNMTDKQAGESSADSEHYFTDSDFSSKKLRALKT